MSLGSGGRCAVSKSEPIGPSDLYFYNGEVLHSSVVPPPEGSMKLMLIHFHFYEITTKVGAKLKIQVESIPDTAQYKAIWPLVIKKKKRKKKFVKYRKSSIFKTINNNSNT